MKNLFVPKEIMTELEKKGFAEDCICGYNKSGTLISKVSYSSGRDCECKWGKDDVGTIRAATWMQIIDWFRDVKEIKIVENQRTLHPYQWTAGIIGHRPESCETLSEAIEIALNLIE
jgi:hypothetical protein